MNNSGASLRRAFIAVVPPHEVVEAIRSLVPSEPSRLMKWSAPTRWHVSVDFLGRVNDAQDFMLNIAERLKEIDPFTIRLLGAGAFADARRAEVFWLGVEDPDSGLRAAHSQINEAASEHGIRVAAQIFTPHLTLARLTRKADLRPEIDALSGVGIGDEWFVQELTFFEAPRPARGAEKGPYIHLSTLSLRR